MISNVFATTRLLHLVRKVCTGQMLQHFCHFLITISYMFSNSMTRRLTGNWVPGLDGCYLWILWIRTQCKHRMPHYIELYNVVFWQWWCLCMKIPTGVPNSRKPCQSQNIEICGWSWICRWMGWTMRPHCCQGGNIFWVNWIVDVEGSLRDRTNGQCHDANIWMNTDDISQYVLDISQSSKWLSFFNLLTR